MTNLNFSAMKIACSLIYSTIIYSKRNTSNTRVHVHIMTHLSLYSISRPKTFSRNKSWGYMGEISRIQSFAKTHTFPMHQYRFREKKSLKRLDRALAFRLIVTEIDLALSLSLFLTRAPWTTYSRTRASSKYSAIYLVGTGNHVTADAVNVLNTAWGVGCRYI